MVIFLLQLLAILSGSCRPQFWFFVLIIYLEAEDSTRLPKLFWLHWPLLISYPHTRNFLGIYMCCYCCSLFGFYPPDRYGVGYNGSSYQRVISVLAFLLYEDEFSLGFSFCVIPRYLTSWEYLI